MYNLIKLFVWTSTFILGLFLGWVLTPIIDNAFTIKTNTVEVEVVKQSVVEVKSYESTITNVDRWDTDVFDISIKDLWLTTEDFKVGDKIKIIKE
jgi:hypothetical protein